MPRLVHIEQGHRAAFTRPYGLVVASCDKRADGRLRRRIMPPVARLKVAKAVHQNALAPTPFALVPHRPVNLSPETATQAMYMAWGATCCGWDGAAALYAGHPGAPRALQ